MGECNTVDLTPVSRMAAAARAAKGAPSATRASILDRITARSRAQGSISEADSNGVTSRRGRPIVFSEEQLHRASGYSYARRVETKRGAQDLVYRMFAIVVIEHYCEAFPESADTLRWLLKPRRYSLLSELGRVAQPKSDENGEFRWTERDLDLLVRTALQVAEQRPSTKDGIAMVRAIRQPRKRLPQVREP